MGNMLVLPTQNMFFMSHHRILGSDGITHDIFVGHIPEVAGFSWPWHVPFPFRNCIPKNISGYGFFIWPSPCYTLWLRQT